MRRYIVKFKGGDKFIFHAESTNQSSVMINLSAESLGYLGNNFFTEGETKTFELAVNLEVSVAGENSDVAGDSYMTINYAITVHNGEIDLQVKPFTFDPYSLA